MISFAIYLLVNSLYINAFDIEVEKAYSFCLHLTTQLSSNYVTAIS